MSKETGRPTKYNEQYHPLLAEYMATAGLTDKEMSDKLGISESTFNLWKLKHPSFSESLKAGKDKPDDMVENALLQRALGYSCPETKVFNYMGEVIKEEITKHYPPDTTAMIYWLKNRRRGKWMDKPVKEDNEDLLEGFKQIAKALRGEE